MKILISLLLTTSVTFSMASEEIGDPHTQERLVVLTFDGYRGKAVFYITAGKTQEEIIQLLRTQCQRTIQQRPKTIVFSTDEKVTFPAILTDSDLEKLSPDGNPIQLKVIEYEQLEKRARY